MEVLKDMVVFVVYAFLFYLTINGSFRLPTARARWAFRFGFLVSIAFYTLVLVGIGVL